MTCNISTIMGVMVSFNNFFVKYLRCSSIRKMIHLQFELFLSMIITYLVWRKGGDNAHFSFNPFISTMIMGKSFKKYFFSFFSPLLAFLLIYHQISKRKKTIFFLKIVGRLFISLIIILIHRNNCKLSRTEQQKMNFLMIIPIFFKKSVQYWCWLWM